MWLDTNSYRKPAKPIVLGRSPSAIVSNEVFRITILLAIHPAARRHGIADQDIKHAVISAMAIDEHSDETRLYLGPARDAELLEVVTIIRDTALN